jgi:hypothetical protein
MLDDTTTRQVDINWWRPGGTAWFTVLHQAALHRAPVRVVASLIRRSALVTLAESRGRTAYDVLMDREYVNPSANVSVEQRSRTLLARRLAPTPSPLAAEEIRALDSHLREVIDGRIGGVLFDGRDPSEVLRYPPVGVLHEITGHHVWFPVPGMYGGFDITLQDDFLDVKSWCRIVGGSGQHHVITTAGSILVDEGFI